MSFSPMMQHYLQMKEKYKDCILFYRIGDFYEMFFDDAKLVSRELELTLTGKECGTEKRAPMCGVPFHAADTYIDRLVKNGHKVAICEQLEDPKLAKGLVKRDVIRIVTPGTNMEPGALDETRNNYLMSIVYLGDRLGVAYCDYSTGDFFVTEVKDSRELFDEIAKISPAEIITNQYFAMSGISLDDLKERQHISTSVLDDSYFDEDTIKSRMKEHFHVAVLDGLGLSDFPTGFLAAGSLLNYLYETQKNSLPHITQITPYLTGKYMLIDSSSRRNLELTETLREKARRGTLLWVLDKTRTAMGARTLRTVIEQPLLDKKAILKRQDAIEEMFIHGADREEIREYLNAIYDLERIMTRISCKTANPRDLIAFRTSIGMIPSVKSILSSAEAPLLKEIYDQLDDCADLYDLIGKAIVDDPPILLREGGIIKEGYSEEADKLRKAKTDGRQWIADLESKGREETGIKNLRIRYNKVFGYYFEVTNSYKSLVPESWERKQTLTNAERYTTKELKELENMILGAEDRLNTLEYDLFCEVREKIAAQIDRVRATSKALAALDVICSLAKVAEQNNYVRPKINTKGVIDIKEGRHPVVEKMLKDEQFVANDTYLNKEDDRIAIITGPNMAGKSTYMRQTALIVLMAQTGSFVPAESADIGLVDRIFTRVGASDDLASGQSTFMVEMTEVANILNNATPDSLLILDEIGRGTSTYDGLGIAWAVVEYIATNKKLGSKTLFATHYHELTELEGKIPGVKNYCIAVKEHGETIVFLRRIVRGGADKSYGVQVARLAGIPKPVLERAAELVEELSGADISQNVSRIAEKGTTIGTAKKKREETKDYPDEQLSLFEEPKEEPDGADALVDEIKSLDITHMTPLDALNKLFELQGKAGRIS
ncbi:MAG: DNA mismatch repair protein MutS [Lachnospiraceae bacterium]|jgi:DNA mismatch repair protein MutS